jgi:hypothetical protein
LGGKPKKNSIAREELNAILPFYLLCAGIMLFVCLIISIITGFDYRLYSGIVIGCLVSITNFYLLSLTSEKITSRGGDKKRAGINAGASYGARYIGMFVIFSIFFKLEIINAAALIPLFIPKIFYTFKYTLIKSAADNKKTTD